MKKMTLFAMTLISLLLVGCERTDETPDPVSSIDENYAGSGSFCAYNYPKDACDILCDDYSSGDCSFHYGTGSGVCGSNRYDSKYNYGYSESDGLGSAGACILSYSGTTTLGGSYDWNLCTKTTSSYVYTQCGTGSCSSGYSFNSNYLSSSSCEYAATNWRNSHTAPQRSVQRLPSLDLNGPSWLLCVDNELTNSICREADRCINTEYVSSEYFSLQECQTAAERWSEENAVQGNKNKVNRQSIVIQDVFHTVDRQSTVPLKNGNRVNRQGVLQDSRSFIIYSGSKL